MYCAEQSAEQRTSCDDLLIESRRKPYNFLSDLLFGVSLFLSVVIRPKIPFSRLQSQYFRTRDIYSLSV